MKTSKFGKPVAFHKVQQSLSGNAFVLLFTLAACLVVFFVLNKKPSPALPSDAYEERLRSKSIPISVRESERASALALKEAQEAARPPAAVSNESREDTRPMRARASAGRVEFTAKELELLKASQGFGNNSEEARKILDSIPEEAFTSDW